MTGIDALGGAWMIRNAVLPGREGRWRLAVSEGRIAEVVPDGDGGGYRDAWDADGRLLSPAFVDPHVHVDKSLTSDRVPDAVAAVDLESAIRAVRRLKSEFTEDDVATRAVTSLEMGLVHGTTVARTHCEADRHVGLRAIAGVQAAAKSLAGRVDVQLIAFPQEGWFETAGSIEDGAAPFIEQALQAGVRIVGGNVNKALWPSDPERQVDESFALAARYDCDIDYHLDNWDSPASFTLPYVARKTLEQGWQGRVAVSHIASLACVGDAEATDTIDAVKQADVNVCVLPTRIRLTRVMELMEAGVNVACGTDNMRDPFVRYGDADPLKALLLLAQLTHQLHNAGLERLWRTMTDNAARMLRLPDYGLAAGCAADLVLFDAGSVPEAILLQAPRLAVFKRGVQVAGRLRMA
ncbi:MAG: amidohydrolase family protein [Pigmentiphaga sp.]|uniref:amidohydrolase family protein n=1 Tax=Pigmentiphaga sp. TaxID=1977564 RepID=UPI0029AB223F|nr:amidohydrolase family protein [Pigmentiphaga sp.]MDX3906899.1 amidohydrolase family protein [Pigmentiphaga sp.]